jgi:hypothetical protein
VRLHCMAAIFLLLVKEFARRWRLPVPCLTKPIAQTTALRAPCFVVEINYKTQRQSGKHQKLKVKQSHKEKPKQGSSAELPFLGS